MRIALFSAKAYEQPFFDAANAEHGNQAFFTREAMENIAATTLANVTAFEAGSLSGNELGPEHAGG